MSKRRNEDRPNIVRMALNQRSYLDELLADPRYRRTTVRQYVNSMNPPDARGPVYEDGIAHKWRLSLRVGEVYAVTPDMFHVVEQAGSELPDDFIAEHHHLHAEHGFLYLPEKIIEPVGIDAAPVDFLTWHNGTGWSDRSGGTVAGIEVNLWTRVQNDVPYPSGSDFLPYGLSSLGFRLHGYDGDVQTGTSDQTLSNAVRFVIALQMLMRQELPSMHKWAVPRSDIPYLRRAQLPHNPVTVIDLRRRQYREYDDAPEGSGRHLTQRHIRRGHWHGHWVGPSHAQHPGDTTEKVKVWLYHLPTVVGPDDAPLAVTPQRVHVVRR